MSVNDEICTCVLSETEGPLSPLRRELDKLQDRAVQVEASALQALGVRQALAEATEELRVEFDIESLLKPLQELPCQIKALRLDVHLNQDIFNQAVEALKVAEANIEMTVNSEFGDNGKPRYSNAETRAAEVRIRKQIDAEYQAGRARLDEASQTLAEAQATLDMALQQFEAAKLAAQLTAAQLAAIQR